MGRWMNFFCVSLLLLLATPLVANSEEPKEPPAASLMPQLGDFALMWWAEGFPHRVPEARWLRSVQTGSYAVVLDTEKLTFPHFGKLDTKTSYAAQVTADSYAWKKLPPAKLVLRVRTGGKTYLATAGGKWSRWDGPRLIDSGRFFQRSDVTNLTFTADDGTKLNADTRFEMAAWPEQLGLILAVQPKAPWNDAELEIVLTNAAGKTLKKSWSLPKSVPAPTPAAQAALATAGKTVADAAGVPWPASQIKEVALTLNPATFSEVTKSPVQVEAFEQPKNKPLPVDYNATRLWHRVNLNGVEPMMPKPTPQLPEPTGNDTMERIRLELNNPTDQEQVARLLFEKSHGGFRQRFGAAITGISAILRNTKGEPTGIPVQLSKNWHTHKEEKRIYSGCWLHAFSQVRLPAGAKVTLELVIVYGHYGGLPAASHAQLCLIGWGSNQLWDESALGSWGESICYEPDRAQARAAVLDVRPMMVDGMGGKKWGWTHNVGGADFFRLEPPATPNAKPNAKAAARVYPHAMRTFYHKYGPCRTEVTYAGKLAKQDAISHRVTTSLSRTDDLVRATYKVRLDVSKPVDFSRFVIFQVGADTYSYTSEKKMALGNAAGLLREWDTQPGGNIYRDKPMQCTGETPWISLHQANSRAKEEEERRHGPKPDRKIGAWANRGIVVRAWKAKLGGKEAQPWVAERGINIGRRISSTIDFVPPPGVTQLLPGDFVEATFEFLVIPQKAEEYYGPNEPLRNALQKWADTWKMVHREASGNGSGYSPVTIQNLPTPHRTKMVTDDFWQTDYDAASKTWSQTFNKRK